MKELTYSEVIQREPIVGRYINKLKSQGQPRDRWAKYERAKQDLDTLIPPGGYDAVLREIAERLQI